MEERSLETRLETLEIQREEIDLLKTEIKQTLVDLKEMLITDGANFLARTQESQSATPQSAANGGLSSVSHEQPGCQHSLAPSPSVSPLAEENEEAPALQVPLPDYQNGPHPSANLDTAMMGNVIWWLGTAKRRGLTLQLLTPILEVYEMSGYISHAMSKMILRSMTDLDSLVSSVSGNQFSPQDYADGLHQLHDIICTPGSVMDPMISNGPGIDRDTKPSRLVSQQGQQEIRTASNDLGIARDPRGRFRRSV